MAATDDALAAVLRPLLDAGRDGRTLVVLTSDHGESLGEHGELTHGLFAYEATLRVPLVLYAPRLLSSRRRVARPSATWTSCRPCWTRWARSCPSDLPGRSLLRGGGRRAPRARARATSRR